MRLSNEMLLEVINGRTILNTDVSDLCNDSLQMLIDTAVLVNDPSIDEYSWLHLAMLYGREGLDYSHFPSSDGDTFMTLMDSAFAQRCDLVGKAKHLVLEFGPPNSGVYHLFTTRWGNDQFGEELLALKGYLVSIGVHPPKYNPSKHDSCLGADLAQKIFS